MMRWRSVWKLVLAAVTLAGSASAQIPNLRGLEEPFPPEAAGMLALADWDHDGDVDGLPFSAAYLIVNDGDARFSAQPTATAIGTSGTPNLMPWNGLAYGVADLNSDGLPDLVTGYGYTLPWSWVRVWINQGGGVLSQSPIAFPLPSPANQCGYTDLRAIVPGDVDGDGDVDLVISVWCTVWGSNRLELFLNNGNGAFVNATAQIPPVPVLASQVYLRDLDQDWDLDIFVSDNVIGGGPCGSTSPVQRVFWNNGAGQFSPPQTVPGPSVGENSVALADLNADGLPDLVYSSFFSSPLCAASCGVSMNLGGGAFGPLASSPCAVGGALVAFDLNGGGTDEVVRLTASGITVHSGTSAGLSAPLQTIPVAADGGQVVDIDGDGDLDVVITFDDLVITFTRRTALLLNAQGTLVPDTPSLWGLLHDGPAALGDVDGDGDQDYVAATKSPPFSLVVALNDGSGALTYAPAFCSGGACPSVAGAPTSVCGQPLLKAIFPVDVNADGLLDLYVADGPPGLAACGPAPAQPDQLFVNTGGAWALSLTLPLAGSRTTQVKHGDLNGDGRPDLIIGRASPALSSLVVFNLGAQGWSAPTPLPSHASDDLAVYDADGDGDLDIFEANGSLGPALLLNDGSGNFTQAATTGLPNAAALTVVAGDLDGDGDQDLVLNNVAWANNGSFTFMSTVTATSLIGPRLFDADGDGDLDLGFVTPPYASAFLSLNNGAGAFGPAQAIASGAVGVLLAGDLDRDDDVDLVVPGARVLTNITRQIARGSLLRPGRIAALDLFGPAGGTWALFGSSGTSVLQVPPIGPVLLDLGNLVQFGSGTLSPGGAATLSTPLPPYPALLGSTTYLQALMGPPAHVTNLEIMTVLGL